MSGKKIKLKSVPKKVKLESVNEHYIPVVSVFICDDQNWY